MWLKEYKQILGLVHDGVVKNAQMGYEPPPRRFELKGTNLRRNLASLRMVSRAFRDLVTPLLFQHVVVKLLGKGSYSLNAFQELSRSPLRRLVHRLELDAQPPPPVDPQDMCDHTHHATTEYMRGAVRLAVIVHSDLHKFSEVKALKLVFQETSWDAAWMRGIQDVFASIAIAIRRAQFRKLDELALWTSSSCDYRLLLEGEGKVGSSSGSLFQQLRHLDLRYQPREDQDDDPDRHGRGPRHMEPPRQVIQLLPNLRSLWIKRVDYLVVDQSAFSPSFRLQSLSLAQSAIDADVLISLIEQSKEALERVIFTYVHLRSGEWSDVFRKLCELPRITYLHLEYCGYMEGERRTAPGMSLDKTTNWFLYPPRGDDLDAWRSLLGTMEENKRRIRGIKPSENTDMEAKRAEEEELAKMKRIFTARFHAVFPPGTYQLVPIEEASDHGLTPPDNPVDPVTWANLAAHVNATTRAHRAAHVDPPVHVHHTEQDDSDESGDSWETSSEGSSGSGSGSLRSGSD
ncbi:protease inhibitor [Fusarium albosuccineum]|uniref:Protease inhibitor n=1 Tax=Fusarium albosuccineum TaxID=1237068 RepID=A0A8H4LD26_9HYPO|nr:protease inhibitor [Fusarium albosuccineum]